MKIEIDSKSTLIGLGAGVLGTLLVGAASSTPTPGRYETAGAGNHAVIVDTMTGEAWSAYMSSTEGKTDADFYKKKPAERR
jgi:hypothetical protein